MKQAIICTILSASDTSLWRLLLKGFYRRSRRADKDLKTFLKTGKIWPEDDGRDSSVWCSTLFFWRGGGSPEDHGTLQGCRSSTDSMFARAHGDCECLRLDACLRWLCGAGGACVVELRVNGVKKAGWRRDAFRRGRGYACGLTENECKGSVCDIQLGQLWQGDRGSGDHAACAPFLPGGGTTPPISNTGGCFV